jgi:hypothetical protein
MLLQRVRQRDEIEPVMWVHGDFDGPKMKAPNRALYSMKRWPFYGDGIARPRKHLKAQCQSIKRTAGHDDFIDRNGKTRGDITQRDLAAQVCFGLSRRQRIP